MWSGILVAVLLLVALVAYTLYGHRRHLAISTGPKIDRASRSNTALLLIDLQDDFTSSTAKYTYPAEALNNGIKAINKLVETANANGSPVISIRQTFVGWYINFLVKLLNEGRGSLTSKGLDIDARIDGDIDHDIVKSRADAFHEAELDRVLDRHHIGKLIIVGLDGDFCVKATMQAALNRGYDVSFSDATTLAHNQQNWRETKSRLVALGAKDGIDQTSHTTSATTPQSEPA
ncbi:cysteine hydrolase family protein [Thalassospira lucentensis]|uniref:Isochorismatase n=1 Tax=Thalassospira lucentensis TaxID=168935 RepID=A0A358HNY5_9PROT|nr:isochorismatase family cysteine hydrolase [Thalassospira lucentensis]HBU96883.1 isochorismatase [Thalassospira lucentensis]HCW66083.1 isochorismatase [Thalassospira lucentensis]